MAREWWIDDNYISSDSIFKTPERAQDFGVMRPVHVREVLPDSVTISSECFWTMANLARIKSGDNEITKFMDLFYAELFAPDDKIQGNE